MPDEAAALVPPSSPEGGVDVEREDVLRVAVVHLFGKETGQRKKDADSGAEQHQAHRGVVEAQPEACVARFVVADIDAVQEGSRGVEGALDVHPHRLAGPLLREEADDISSRSRRRRRRQRRRESGHTAGSLKCLRYQPLFRGR